MILLLSVVYNIIGPILLIVALAILIERCFAPNPRTLSTLVFYLFSPALVMSGLAHSDAQVGEIGQIGVMAAAVSLSMALLGWGAARLFQFEGKLESGFMLAVMLINAGNYGIPLNEFAFGAAGLQRAIVFFVGTALIGNTLGVFFASRSTASMWRSVVNVLTVPLPYATILGLVINLGYVSLPTPVDRAITLLGQAAVPAMLVILGLQLSRTSLKGKMKPIVLATLTRLVIAPLIAFVLATWLGLSGVTRQVAIVQASMPTAVTSTILATQFESDVEFVSAVVLVSSLASVITLSILLALIM